MYAHILVKNPNPTRHQWNQVADMAQDILDTCGQGNNGVTWDVDKFDVLMKQQDC